MAVHRGMGHSGAERVSLMIRDCMYIKSLAKKARKLISSFELYQKAKPMNIRYDIDAQTILCSEPNDLVAFDTHGPMPISSFGYKYIMIMYDVFSKFTTLYALKSLSTKECLNKVLKDYIPKYGTLRQYLSDNASIFASKKWKDSLEEKGIKVYHCSAYHPASNPSERELRDVTAYLRVLCHKNHRTWFKTLPMIHCIMNRTPNPTT
jgi:Integrase core domain.